MTTTSTTIRMTGRDAIAYAQAHGLALSTYTDPTAEGRDGVSIEEARRIASEDPSLVYLDIPAYIVESLAEEATAAGDEALALACAAALDGEEASQRIVIRALVDAAAQVGT